MVATYKVQKGVHKEKCDDSALIDSKVIGDGSGSIVLKKEAKVVIADGVGRNAGGDKASLFMMNALSDIVYEDNDNLRRQLLESNRLLLSYANTIPGQEFMATTLTGIIINADEFVMFHCGNTRIYSLQGNFLKQITKDQTTYQWLMNIGNLEAAKYCNKSEIRGAFGGGSSKFSDTLVVEKIFDRGVPAKILMTSDGVHDVLEIDEIENIVTCSNYSSTEKINMLIDSAVNKGSEDDCTAILIDLK